MTAVIIVLAVVVILVIIYTVFFCMAFVKTSPKLLPDVPLEAVLKGSSYSSIFGDVKASIIEALSWPYKELEITSFDGLRLHARLSTQDSPRGCLIFMHGYRSRPYYDIAMAAEFYRSLGFDILFVDQRCHGKSQGTFITYGVKESRDCADWAFEMAKLYGEDFPIILSGVSMGASTVLMASGLPLPESVKGILADCGFHSPYDIISHVSRRMHVPTWFSMPMMKLLAKVICGFSLTDTTTLKAMEVNTRPIFFAHGTGDKFVPYEMSVKNYNACKSAKKLLLVEGAEHALSFVVERERYEKEAGEFIESIIK